MQELKIGNRAFNGNIDYFEDLSEISNFMPVDHDLTINLSRFRDVKPFNMLVLALSIKQLSAYFNRITFVSPAESIDGYMQYMGFYETCGAPAWEINRGSHRPGKYICITKIDFTPCGSIEADYEMMEREAQKLSTMIQFDKELAAYIKYCFFEMIRNSYEHAATSSVYVCAQYWPTQNLVELAIVDEGQGIKNAMESKYKQKNELELIKYAMVPGISVESNHKYLPKGDYYQNSGYGLYLTKELSLAYDGSFILCSGNYALRYYKQGNQDICKCYNTKFQGTAIAIQFSTSRSQNFKELIGEIKERGQELTRQYDEAIHTASKSSGGNRKF